jgi:hypothetical protein
MPFMRAVYRKFLVLRYNYNILINQRKLEYFDKEDQFFEGFVTVFIPQY